MHFKFDENITLSWGYFKCNSCNQVFYNLKSPNHKPNCIQDSRRLTYYFGEKEVKEVLENGKSRCGQLTLKILQDQFHDLLQ